MKNKKTPAIRFKGFTDDWEQRKLGKLANIIDPHPSHRAPSEVKNGIPFIGIGDVEIDGSIDYVKSRKVAVSIYEEHHKRYDLAIPSLGIGRVASLGKVVRLRNDIGKYTVSPTMSVMQFEKNSNIDFLYAAMNSEVFQKQFVSQSNGSTRQSVGIQDLRVIEVSVSTHKEEQEEIGKFFKKLDTLITLHQRKLEKLKNFKKAILEKMFPQNGEKKTKIHFQGFTDDWEQRKLGDVACFSKGWGYSKSDLQDSGIPIILYGRLYTQYETNIKNVDTYTTVKKDSVFSKSGDVIVPASGETAEDISVASVVEKTGILLGGDLNVIHPNSIIDSIFLAVNITNGQPHHDMAKRAQGKSVVHLHNKDLAQITLLYPSLDEQKNISRFIENIDNLITLHQRKLEKLQQIKKAMLEKMFV